MIFLEHYIESYRRESFISYTHACATRVNVLTMINANIRFENSLVSLSREDWGESWISWGTESYVLLSDLAR
jgi:hypothetical protein